MAPRIGFPRALHFLQYYPLWRTFLEELGATVVVSPATQRDILAAGARLVADVTCLPVKVYAGHVVWLRDHGQVDYVLVPAIRSVEIDAFHCAKFQALPDIMQSTVPDCPPLLDVEIDWHRRKISPEQAFYKLGRRFCWNPYKVRRAWKRAGEVDERYRAQLVAERLTYPEALASLYPDEAWPARPAKGAGTPLTVAVIGHPYCLYDDYISHDLINRLRGLGVRVVTSEMVPAAAAAAGVALTTGQVRWFYEHWMSGAAGHYLAAPEVDGLIAVLAFTCGPDSAMVETITRRAHARQRPFMSLILDEHGSAAGLVTRLEAFVDMLGRRESARPAGAGPATASAPATPAEAVVPATLVAPAVLSHLHKPRLGFPSMGTTVVPIKSLFRGVGAELELGPPLSSRTISLGARYSPEFICTPYKYILGNMIEMLEAGADTLLYVDGPELCRNSSYTQMLNDVLHDLGYKFSFASTAILEGGIFTIGKFLRQFAPHLTWRDVLREIRLALGKMHALDEIEQRVQFIRPREIVQGAVDKVWEEAIRRVDEALDLEALKRALRDILQTVNRTPIDPTRRPVRIATTGEYYAVLEPFFNLDLERELGKLGAEVRRTLMMSHWAQGMLILEALGFPRKPHIRRAAKPYLRWDVAGEGWVTVGQSVIHAQQGYDGIIETLPFTCIPEIAALNILPRISREFNIPILSFIFDEQTGRAGMRTRLEAFVDLLFRRREAREAAPNEPVPAAFEAECLGCPITDRCRHRPAELDAQVCRRAAQGQTRRAT